jgi:RND family efflux transporter MFP subunit
MVLIKEHTIRLFRSWGLLVILLVPLFLSGCGEKEAHRDAETATVVNAYMVASSSIENTLRFTGDIRAQRDVRIFSQVPNRIVEFRVDKGDFVRKNEILAVIENSILNRIVDQAQAALQTAQANLTNIESEYERSERLFAEEAISRQQYDLIKTQYESAKAAHKQATAGYAQVRKQYEDSYINAPFDGIIGQRFLELGDMASPGVPVFSIVQVDTMKVVISVSEREYGLMTARQNARLRVASFPDTVFTGYVDKISPILDPISRLGNVELLFPNRYHKLISGMFGELEIILDRRMNVPVIPTYSILYRTVVSDRATRLDERLQRIPYVYVVEDSIAREREITLGYQSGGFAEVRSGVQTGEIIIVRGQHGIDSGDRVEIVEYIEYASREE